MSTYAVVIGLRSGILDTLGDITDLGKVVTHYEPIKDRGKLLERYMDPSLKRAQGVIVAPGSAFHTPTIMAAGGDGLTVEDKIRWDLTVYRAVQDDSVQRDEALEMALTVFDALRRRFDFSAYSVDLEYAPDVRVQNHGYGPLSNYGCWITEIACEYTVPQSFDLT